MPPSFTATSVSVHVDCKAAYDEIHASALAGERDARVLWGSIQKALQRAKAQAQFADRIPVIPRYFVDRYGISNLYCVDVSGFRRVFYTIIERDVFFLDVVDHPTYDKWFPNKGK